jgi:exonuclease VII small subunit
MTIARKLRSAVRLVEDARTALPAAAHSLERAVTLTRAGADLLEQAARLVRRASSDNERIRVTRVR